MPRRKALSQLHESLLASRASLKNKLAGDLANLRAANAAEAQADNADVAFETSCGEVSSRLAALEVEELNRIDRALARLTQGGYGVCESCQAKIPVNRMQALPYTTVCIACERELEAQDGRPDLQSSRSWGQVFDWEAPMEHQRISMTELEMDASMQR